MAKTVATTGQLPAFRFRVELDTVKLYCNQVSGLQQETEEILYRHGDEATYQHKLRGLTSFQDVTLQQGVVPSGNEGSMLSELFSSFNRAEAADRPGFSSDAGSPANYRYPECRIVQLDMNGNEKLVWRLKDCWISAFELEDFDANSSDVQFLTITLKHEGITLEAK